MIKIVAGSTCTPTSGQTGQRLKKPLDFGSYRVIYILYRNDCVWVLIGFETFLWNIVIPILIGGIILTPIVGWFTNRIPR